MLVLLSFVAALLRSIPACFRRRSEQALVELAPRQQLAAYAHTGRRPRLLGHQTQATVLAQIPWDRRGAFLAARHGIRPGELRALDCSDYELVEEVPGLTISKAAKGPNSDAPIRETKNRRADWIPVDDELVEWIEWRLERRLDALRGRLDEREQKT